MNLCLPLCRRPRLSISLPDRQPLCYSAVKCAWDSSCFYFFYGCSAKWEEGVPDTTLPTMVPGEEVLGAAVPGEAEFEAFRPEASPRAEAEVFQVLECEVGAGVVAQDARINI